MAQHYPQPSRKTTLYNEASERHIDIRETDGEALYIEYTIPPGLARRGEEDQGNSEPERPASNT